MGVINDLTGRRFAKLFVLHETNDRQGRNIKWMCKCDCGNYTLVAGALLVTGNTHSCGCYAKEQTKLRNTIHGHNTRLNPTTSEYRSWAAAKNRCTNEYGQNYSDYGGRGIIMCERWSNSFAAFIDDMGNKPTPSHSLDRIDTNGNYEPSNCRWATKLEQMNNTRQNRLIEYKGETKTIGEWSRFLGIRYGLLLLRANGGHSAEEMFETPPGELKIKRNPVILTQAQKDAISNRFSLAVSQYNNEGILLNTYNSITQASKETNILTSSIGNCLKGRSSTAGGFVWKYK